MSKTRKKTEKFSLTKFNLEDLFNRIIKNELTDNDYKDLAGIACAFKDTPFYALFLAITERSRRLLELNRDAMASLRPDFVLGMIHENAVIQNSLEMFIEEDKVRRKNALTAEKDAPPAFNE